LSSAPLAALLASVLVVSLLLSVVPHFVIAVIVVTATLVVVVVIVVVVASFAITSARDDLDFLCCQVTHTCFLPIICRHVTAFSARSLTPC
jgi:hypothetical protein